MRTSADIILANGRWSMERAGRVELSPSGPHHCGYSGVPGFDYRVNVNGVRSLDARGFTLDNRDVHAIVTATIKANPTQSCELLCRLVAIAIAESGIDCREIRVSIQAINGPASMTFDLPVVRVPRPLRARGEEDGR